MQNISIYLSAFATGLIGIFSLRVFGRFFYLYFFNNPNRAHTTSEEDRKKQQEIVSKIWNTIDNDMYDRQFNEWWDPTKPFSSGLHSMTRLRGPYYISKASKELQWTNKEKTQKTLQIVDVGCGGGILSESLVHCAIKDQNYEKVKLIGIDLAPGAIKVAQEHSENLLKELNENYDVSMEYVVGNACILLDNISPNSTDIVVVADVLEHVLDLPIVIENVSKILKPGGIFVFDTVNRSFFSYFIAIFLAQELPFGLSILPSHTHQWGLFVKPDELHSLCKFNHLHIKEMHGFRPLFNFALLKGILNKSKFHEASFTLTNNLDVQYIGFAVKNQDE